MTNTIETTISKMRDYAKAHETAFVNAKSLAKTISSELSDNYLLAENILDITKILGFDSNNLVNYKVASNCILSAWTEDRTIVFRELIADDVALEFSIHYSSYGIVEVVYSETGTQYKDAARDLFRTRCDIFSDIYRNTESVSYSTDWYTWSVEVRREALNRATNFVSHIKAGLPKLLVEFQNNVEAIFAEIGDDYEAGNEGTESN